MKLRNLFTVAALALLSLGCDDDDNTVVECIEATVVGRHCATAGGSYGFVLSLAQPNGNAAGWVDSVGNQYSFAVTALNLPKELRVPGKRVYLAAHQATQAERDALGPRTAECQTPPPLVTLELVQDKPCR